MTLYIKGYLLFLFIFSMTTLHAQSYISYFTGDTSDVQTSTTGVTVLMGGASENDNAMKWFLQHSGGGDIVVIRASGSNGYNDYLYNDLGIGVNSVETILFKNGLAANDPYVIRQIQNAEALWIAGGDQWDYVSYWRNTPVATAINELINIKHIPVGGTSAGMAVLGSIVNTAQNGSVTSEAALANPYDAKVKLLNGGFIENPILNNVITDTHYDNPNRKGRHVAFLARIAQDFGLLANGIACEEYTAICIDTNGIANVYGDYPSDADYAYFIQVNCSIPNTPEICIAGQPLTWNRSHEALKVYKVAGTQTGSNSFDLKDWHTGMGGNWENWYITNGTLNINSTAIEPDCTTAIDDPAFQKGLSVFPNPTHDYCSVTIPELVLAKQLLLYDVVGKLYLEVIHPASNLQLDVSGWPNGIYVGNVIADHAHYSFTFIKT